MDQYINQVIAQIYQTAAEPQKWPDLLHGLTEVIDSVSDDEYTEFLRNVDDEKFTSGSGSSLVENLRSLDLADFTKFNLDDSQQEYAVSLSGLLLQHFTTALSITRKIIDAQEQHHTLINILDRLPIGFINLTDELKVNGFNDYVSDLFDETETLSIADGYLRIANKQSESELIRKIQKIQSGLAQQERLESLIFGVDNVEKIYCVLVESLHAEISDKQQFTLFLTRQNHLPIPDKLLLKQQYHLTDREISVLNSLLTGQSIKQIAEHHEVSEHTVRNQVKSLMSKTGTKRQAELLSHIISLPGSYIRHDILSDKNQRLQAIDDIDVKHPLLRYETPDGYEIVYREFGEPDGIPMIFHHSVIGGGYEIPENLDSLCRKHHYRCLLPVRPGYGETTVPLLSSPVEWANYIYKFQSSLTSKSAVHIGYAMGGIFACATAWLNAESVKHLFVINFGATPVTKQDFKLIEPVYRLNQKLVLTVPSVHKLFYRIFKSSVAINPDLVLNKLSEKACRSDVDILHSEYFKNVFTRQSRAHTQNNADAVSNEARTLLTDWMFSTLEITTSTTILHGDLDRCVPHALAKTHLSQIPNATTEILDGFGHFFIFRHWELILDRLNQAINTKKTIS